MLKLRLLTTEHCHLCEAVLDLLLSTSELAGLPLDVVDIVGHEDLFDCYAEKIPVVQAYSVSPVTGQKSSEQLLAELLAPIDRERLLAFVDSLPAPSDQ